MNFSWVLKKKADYENLIVHHSFEYRTKDIVEKIGSITFKSYNFESYTYINSQLEMPININNFKWGKIGGDYKGLGFLISKENLQSSSESVLIISNPMINADNRLFAIISKTVDERSYFDLKVQNFDLSKEFSLKVMSTLNCTQLTVYLGNI